MLIDLQLHSTYSDGYLAPAEVAKFIAGRGVKIASLTDHHTVGGNGEFKEACLKFGVKPIIGLELYAKLNHKRFNLLWFNFNHHNPDLHKMLQNVQIRRKSRVRFILEKLKTLGFQIDVEKTIDKYAHYIPINHLANDLYSVKKNRSKIHSLIGRNKPREEEIIWHLFYNKKIGKLNESHIDIKRILKLRKKIGGQLILNHPAKYGYVKRDFLTKLKKLGIDGIDVLSPHHSIGAIMYLQAMARELKLIETGGSDFHLHEGGSSAIQNSWDYFQVESGLLNNVKKIIQ